MELFAACEQLGVTTESFGARSMELLVTRESFGARLVKLGAAMEWFGARRMKLEATAESLGTRSLELFTRSLSLGRTFFLANGLSPDKVSVKASPRQKVGAPGCHRMPRLDQNRIEDCERSGLKPE